MILNSLSVKNLKKMCKENNYKGYSNKNTVKVFLTATFQKPLNKWNIPSQCQYYWNIEDEQFCKKRNILNKFLFRYIRKNLSSIPTIRCPTISDWFYSIII